MEDRECNRIVRIIVQNILNDIIQVNCYLFLNLRIFLKTEGFILEFTRKSWSLFQPVICFSWLYIPNRKSDNHRCHISARKLSFRHYSSVSWMFFRVVCSPSFSCGKVNQCTCMASTCCALWLQCSCSKECNKKTRQLEVPDLRPG